MGGILSRWRKKPSTIEELEGLDKEISYIERAKQSDLVTQKKVVGALILYSVVLYLLAAAIYYFYYLPEQWTQRLLYCTPLLVFPIIVVLVKKFLHWYFVKRISKNEEALVDLKDKKKTILEEVMEKETYKKAKEILERFDPDKLKTIQSAENTPAPARAPQGQELRQRSAMKGPTLQTTQPTPIRPQAQSTPHARHVLSPGAPTPVGNGTRANFTMAPGTPMLAAGPPMPRPVLPRERTTVDKLVEYLVGDGPSNRYALICKQCLSHNGMALKEEFEYLAFRCCYCYTVNPARKQRPNAPKIPEYETQTPKAAPTGPRRQLAHTIHKQEENSQMQDLVSEDETLDESHLDTDTQAKASGAAVNED